ncbi:MAG: GNAT family protein [Planctomycetota bacterium]
MSRDEVVAVGARTILRYPTRADRDEIIALIDGSRDFLEQYAPMPREHDALWRMCISETRTGDSHKLFVCRAEDGAITGRIAISNILRRKLQSANLGYWLGAPFEGQGLMTEAMRMTVRFAFMGLQLHRVEACIQPGNERSIALATRCGMRYEGFSPKLVEIGGVWCDHERYAITVEHWRTLAGDVRAEDATLNLPSSV